MSKFYNGKFLFDTIFLAGTEIEALEKWSAYNDDKLSDELAALKKSFDTLKKKAFETESVEEEDLEDEEALQI